MAEKKTKKTTKKTVSKKELTCSVCGKKIITLYATVDGENFCSQKCLARYGLTR